MRYLLLVLLIATFPLRGFASAGMQTGMSLQQASMEIAMAAAMTTAQPSADTQGTPLQSAATQTTEATSMHACCAQCNSCDICHLLLGQPAASMGAALPAAPTLPASPSYRFASADAHRAQKPPLALI